MIDETCIRDINPNDFDDIKKILKDQIGNQYSKELELELKDIESGRVNGIVAVSKDTGLCGYASWRYRVESAYLETIAVDNKLQSQGIGGRLLRIIEQIILDEKPGITLLNVVTDSDALRTINFYIKNKFVPSGIVQDEFIPGTSQIHLSKKLSEN